MLGHQATLAFERVENIALSTVAASNALDPQVSISLFFRDFSPVSPTLVAYLAAHLL